MSPLGTLQADYEVMVTAGANQAFVNLVLALLDAGDRRPALLWRPLYFNHEMSLHMTGERPGSLAVQCACQGCSSLPVGSNSGGYHCGAVSQSASDLQKTGGLLCLGSVERGASIG